MLVLFVFVMQLLDALYELESEEEKNTNFLYANWNFHENIGRQLTLGCVNWIGFSFWDASCLTITPTDK